MVKADREAALAPYRAEYEDLVRQFPTPSAPDCQDSELRKGTRIFVEGRGSGTYIGFCRNLVGPNEHTIAFDSGETAAVFLETAEWAILSRSHGPARPSVEMLGVAEPEAEPERQR